MDHQPLQQPPLLPHACCNCTGNHHPEYGTGYHEFIHRHPGSNGIILLHIKWRPSDTDVQDPGIGPGDLSTLPKLAIKAEKPVARLEEAIIQIPQKLRAGEEVKKSGMQFFDYDGAKAHGC